jgi:hypothetical protein
MPKSKSARNINRKNRRKTAVGNAANTGKVPSRNGQQPQSAWIGFSNPPRLLSTDNHCTFVQDAPGVSLTQAAGAAALGAIGFQLSYLDQYTTFTALFDEYKVDWMQITFRPHANASPLTVNTVIVPQLITVVDFDDSTAPASLAVLREYDNSQVSIFETQVRTFVPGWVDASGETLHNDWLDCAFTGIPFFGCKYGIEAGAGGQTSLQYFSVQIRVQLSFRHVR